MNCVPGQNSARFKLHENLQRCLRQDSDLSNISFEGEMSAQEKQVFLFGI